jgi:hypothetical protein
MSMSTIPLAMPDDLLAEVKRTAEDTQLSSADIMRQAIKAGLPQVREALAAKGSFLDGVKPLSKAVLEKVCRERPDNEGLEDIAQIMANQAWGE